MSRSLAVLERDLGVELVRRTTRRSNPTDAGLAFYQRLSAALAEIDAAKVATSNRRVEATGVLRIAGSTGFTPLYVVPALPEFLAAHPGVEVELELSDRYIDLVGEGFDLAIRVGQMPDSALKARLLADSRRVVFAAPSYLATHGHPRNPEDLARHQCIVRTSARDGNAWPFKMNGRSRTVKVAGRFRTSGAVAANAAAAAGLGIASGPLWQVRSLLDRGAVELLADTVRATVRPDSCGLAGDQAVAGPDTAVCRFPRRAPAQAAALTCRGGGRFFQAAEIDRFRQ